MEHEDEHEKNHESSDGLLSRLKVIEDQPLDSRAAAYVRLYDEQRERLEGIDSPGSNA